MDVDGCRNLSAMQVILIDDSDIDNKVNTKLLKLAPIWPKFDPPGSL